MVGVVHGFSKRFVEWYHKTNKTEDTNKLILLAFKIIAILHKTPYSPDVAPAGVRSEEYGGLFSFPA
jgi:hypothetical protein